MHAPYTLDFTDSFYAAHSCAALLLTALLLFWRSGSKAARGVMLLAVWLAVVAGTIGPSLGALGGKADHDTFLHVLVFSSVLGTVACALALRPLVSVIALLGSVPLWWLGNFVKDSDGELSGLHLAWLGLLLGLLVAKARPRTVEPAPPEREASYAAHDWTVFVVAAALTALVCIYVMHRRDGAADEWGYTFQAAVFAKGRAYAASPKCEPFLESFYVFENEGRLFSQYTPGWPLILAPFVWIRAVWLSGPIVTGFMAVGMARLARSAMRSFGPADAPTSATTIRIAGTWGAVLSTLGPMVLVNGGSRYPHVCVVALYAWTLEGVLMVSTPGLTPARQRRWGFLLGTVALFDVAVRPADGAFVGLGAAVLLLYLVARRRVGLQAFAMAALGVGLWGALMLVILRLQLGKWFTTGYSLNAVLHPWNVVKYSKPLPSQWKYGLPLATASYCWWPCSMALGLAGLAMLRGRATGLITAFVLGCVPYIVYTEWLDLGQRTYDWGYGPRYLMVLLVPMAVGSAVALAPLTVAALERVTGGASALVRGGPLALAVFAVVSGLVRVVPLVWGTVADHTHRHSALQRAVEDAKLHDAIVIATPGTTGFSDIDLPTNLPLDLYPDQDVILAADRATPKEAYACLRAAFPTRKLYSAAGVGEVHILPPPY
ncbi:MAG: hypothetical protein ABSE49_10575 [Polyangiaceae bacterium]